MNLKFNRVRLTGLSIVFLLAMSLFVFSCGKDDSVTPDPGGNTGRFKATDFKISNIVTSVGSSILDIEYEEINTTSMDYDYDIDGRFRIKWSVKTSDGIQYQTDRLLETKLDASAAAALSCRISYTEGKVIDISTLAYEIYYDN